MRTLILEPSTAGLDSLLERRRASGLDRLDEVWDGVLHMVPAPRGEHADIAQQLAEALGAPARAAGLVPAMGEFNLGLSEHDYRVPDGRLVRRQARTRGENLKATLGVALNAQDVLYAAVEGTRRSLRSFGLTSGVYGDAV